MPDHTAAIADRLPIGQSMKLLEKACDGGSARGCTGLGMFHAMGAAGSIDIGKATTLLDRGCAAGDAEGCTALAERFAHRSTEHEKWPVDQTRATALWQRACDLGTEYACFTVASRYFKGEGSKQDIPRGVAVMRRGCDGGNAKRCNELAMLHLGMLGGGKEFRVIENTADGLALLDRTCTRMDSDDACRILAQLYATGTKAKKDLARAQDYYGRACPSQDEAKACASLEKLLPAK
jgi:TPR repeat protein